MLLGDFYWFYKYRRGTLHLYKQNTINELIKLKYLNKQS